jgi:hypothetical protein
VVNGVPIDVANAGPGADLITTVSSAASCPTLTLAANASTSVTNASTKFGPSCYSAGSCCTIAAGTTTALPFTPALAQTETTGSAVTLYHKPNDARVIGNSYLSADTTIDASNTSYDLFDIDASEAEACITTKESTREWASNHLYGDWKRYCYQWLRIQ